jgi:hypothetical protein
MLYPNILQSKKRSGDLRAKLVRRVEAPCTNGEEPIRLSSGIPAGYLFCPTGWQLERVSPSFFDKSTYEELKVKY